MSKIQVETDFSEQPMLYAKGAKKTEMLQWKTFSKGPVVFFQHGKVGGKQMESKYTAEAVNIGKANFRDPMAQAKFESQAAWKKKVKEGYYLTVDEAKTAVLIRPMKAHRMDQQGHKLKYPCHAQRKYNGYRCLAICADDGYTFLMSNGGETWTVPHILAELALILKPGDMLDGELYIHGVSLQKLGSLIKANRAESAALEFHMYDMPQKAGKIYPWRERHRNLTETMRTYMLRPELLGISKLKVAETVTLQNEAELTAFNAKVIMDGYEGVILRNLDGNYRFDYRSHEVFKHKDFKDSEFTVLDITSRVHSLNGVEVTIADVCICRNNQDDQTFKVVPRGEISVKKDYWENRENYIGKKLTVRYLERSDDGIPQGNPVGIAFRLTEDLSDEDGESMWKG